MLPGRCWRVVKGSGMGLKHSSALRDAALFAMFEHLFFIWELVVAMAHGIKLYRRFKDDMLL